VQPFVLKRPREPDEGDECADTHRNSTQCEKRPKPAPPKILPSESCKRELGGHNNKKHFLAQTGSEWGP
jgi:hypothetical protein